MRLASRRAKTVKVRRASGVQKVYMYSNSMVTIRTDKLRVQDGFQGRSASAGSYSEGTYETVAHQTYGEPWARAGRDWKKPLTEADVAALDAAERVVLCG